MSSISYLNFDLQIQRASDSGAGSGSTGGSGAGYRLVAESPSGETIRAVFEMPFSDVELENFMLRAGPARRGVRRADTPEVDSAKRFGDRLYNSLFTAEVRAAFQSSLDQTRQRSDASRKRVGVRLRLRLNDVPELAGVPWEYMYNAALNRFLVLSTETPLVRYLDLPERIRPLKVAPPLRILVAIAGPIDYARLDVRQEWLNLNSALVDLEQQGLVQLDLLEEPTLPGLQRQLRRGDYHIFHFIGHGAFDRQAADGLLVFEDSDGRGRDVSGQDLAMLLHDHTPLRLAVLNACEGAHSATDDPFSGVAQSLIQGGLPAVIAMQFEITDRAAILFAHEFYRALADGYSVDACLAEARKVIFTDGRGNGLEWGTPVLYMRSPDGRIFNLQKRAGDIEEPPGAADQAITSGSIEAPPVVTQAADAIEAENAPTSPVTPAPERAVQEARPSAAAPGSQAVGQATVAQPESSGEFSAPAASSNAGATRGAGTAAPPPEGASRSRKVPVLPAVILAAVVLLALVVGFGLLNNNGSIVPGSGGEPAANAQGHNSRGVTAMENGDTVKAIAEYSEAIRLQPDYAEAYLNRGYAYQNKGMNDESIADLTRAIELAPNDGQAYFVRGTTYTYKGDYDAALTDLSRAVELSPQPTDAYYQRGVVYLEKQKYDEAIADFSKALDARPSHSDSYYKRGLAYAGKSDYTAAIREYTRAIEVFNDDSYVYARAEAYRALGDKANAIVDYKDVLKITDDDNMRSDATQRLKDLEGN